VEGISRKKLKEEILWGLEHSPVTSLIGPRQCGKTTIAREISAERAATYFDLENPRDDTRLQNPMTTLEHVKGVIILDEIQRRPDLMPLLRVLADRESNPARFLILGSASPELVRASSESLAGRVRFVKMGGFTLEDVGSSRSQELWLRGGFPRSFLAPTDKESWSWRSDFVQTFLERDLPQLGIRIPPMTLRRFWTMLTHYHGQLWNGSQVASAFGIAHTTARRYLDILSGAFVVRQLMPWFENIGKRVVKTPKVYVRDSGIFHMLANIPSLDSLMSDPKLGASWEGFVVEQVLSRTDERHAYFWAIHSGAELDLLIVADGRRYGFEMKFQDAPKMTKSLHTALADLKLDRVWIVYPGAISYPVADRVECISISELPAILARNIL
jgi:predicted AAA+ superfamily ATPase